MSMLRRWGLVVSAKHRMREFPTNHAERRGISGVTDVCNLLFHFLLCAACLIALVANGTQPSKRTVTATQDSAPAAQQVSQEGAVIAVTAGSVTARSANGYTQTYLVTPDTTVITHGGGQRATAAPHFSVNDKVVILGTIRGGQAVATAVAKHDAGNGGGPPMDYAEGQPIP
jgi:hypothetical protein